MTTDLFNLPPRSEQVTLLVRRASKMKGRNKEPFALVFALHRWPLGSQKQHGFLSMSEAGYRQAPPEEVQSRTNIFRETAIYFDSLTHLMQAEAVYTSPDTHPAWWEMLRTLPERYSHLSPSP